MKQRKEYHIYRRWLHTGRIEVMLEPDIINNHTVYRWCSRKYLKIHPGYARVCVSPGAKCLINKLTAEYGHDFDHWLVPVDADQKA